MSIVYRQLGRRLITLGHLGDSVPFEKAVETMMEVTLAHELGHLVLHMEPQSVTGRVFFDELEDGGSGDRFAEELEADTYAADALVPRDVWLQHRETLVDSTTAVLEFAEQLGVSPAIVAGRARWESGDYAKLNHLLGRGKMAALFSNSIATGVA